MAMTGKAQSIGLLILRIGVGVMFILYGATKFAGGEQVLVRFGEGMKMLGVTGDFKMWGTVAALIQIVGGAALITGAFFRPLCFLLLFVMVMSSAWTIRTQSGFWDLVYEAGRPINMGTVFLALLIIGPGRYNLGKYINPFSGGD